LIGSPTEFTSENRAFNATNIITIIVLLILLPFNLFIKLYSMAAILAALIVLISFFYLQSRIKKRFLISLTAYAVVSYVTLIANFYYNSGINGPTIFLFFLTFHLLIAFTPKSQHFFWTIVHSITGISLLLASYYQAVTIVNTYHNREDRFIDIGSSYLVTLGVIYAITIYLRNNYNREKELAELRAIKIGRQKQQLEALNDQKNKLFSIVAHDLRSPLNSIQSYLELLTETELSNEEKTHIEKELLTQTKNTSDLLLNLLSWSKTQMEGVSLKLTALPLQSILQRTIDTQKIIASKKDIQLNYSISDSLQVTGDADMIQLVVRNLVSNAIKFSPTGSQIVVEAKPVNDGCQIMVKDEGIGMDEEKQKSIFSFKASATFGTNNEKGVGLGLMLCKEFTELQDGKIRFESTPGKGTTFFVTLPLSTVQ
jgi:signal transduction histidine kinase